MGEIIPGKLLLYYGEINEEQIKKAVRFQIKNGGNPGTILIGLGYLDEKSHLKYLAIKSNSELFSIMIIQNTDKEVLPIKRTNVP